MQNRHVGHAHQPAVARREFDAARLQGLKPQML
jgi:hypothetical protein